MTRTGFGFDAHRYGGSGPLVLGGVEIPDGRPLEGTSDADVALHAIADALLGAAVLGDLGAHFPSSDDRWRGVRSAEILAAVRDMVADAGFGIGVVDVTIVAQSTRVAPHREAMRDAISAALAIERALVSVKATTTDGMGFLGRDEGIAAFAVATLEAVDQPGGASPDA